MSRYDPPNSYYQPADLPECPGGVWAGGRCGEYVSREGDLCDNCIEEDRLDNAAEEARLESAYTERT